MSCHQEPSVIPGLITPITEDPPFDGERKLAERKVCLCQTLVMLDKRSEIITAQIYVHDLPLSLYKYITKEAVNDSLMKET